jgi:hypothetical protein
MFEWFNTTLPLMNTVGMKDIAVLRVGPTATGVDLRTLFGNRPFAPTGAPDVCTPSGLPNIDAGHFYSIMADGAGPVPTGAAPWRAYVALATTVRTISETDVATGACWALVDGQTLRGRMPPGGRDRGTGLASGIAGAIATGLNSPVLNFKSAPGGGTGWLRIYRSSLGDGQVAGDQWPGPNVMF